MVLNLAILLNNVPSYIILFLFTVVESYVIIPGASLILASYGAFATSFSGLLFLIFIIFLASIIGDISAYFISRHFSDRLLGYLRKFSWFSKNEVKTRKAITRYEFSFVFFSRFFITGSSQIVNYLAGFEKLDSRKFILAVVTGEIIFSVSYVLIGYLFKDTWNDLIGPIQYALIGLILVIIAGYIVYKIFKMYKKRANH